MKWSEDNDWVSYLLLLRHYYKSCLFNMHIIQYPVSILW